MKKIQILKKFDDPRVHIDENEEEYEIYAGYDTFAPEDLKTAL